MTLRHELNQTINPSSNCLCGKPKSPAQQWCTTCWNAIPTGAGGEYSRRAKELARSIIHCNRIVREHIRKRKQDEETGVEAIGKPYIVEDT